MTNDRAELMLEQLDKAQERLVHFMALGFFVGFLAGVVAAWLMFAAGR